MYFITFHCIVLGTIFHRLYLCLDAESINVSIYEVERLKFPLFQVSFLIQKLRTKVYAICVSYVDLGISCRKFIS